MKRLKMLMATREEYEAREVFGRERKVCLFYEKGHYVGYVWYEFVANEDRAFFIEFIKSENERQGYGRAMIQWLFEHMDVDVLYGEVDEYSKEFWQGIGAEVSDDYADDVREMYAFTLRRESMTLPE